MSEGFRPGWPVTILAAIGLAVLLGLGTWQVQRHFWKTELIANIEAALSAEPRSLEVFEGEVPPFQRFTLKGRLLSEANFLFGFSARNNRPGSHLLQVFEDELGRQWLLERGWIPEEAAAEALAGEFGIEGPIETVVVTRPLKERGIFTPKDDLDRRQLFAEDFEALNGRFGLELQGLPIVLISDLPAGPPWDGLPVSTRPNPDLPNNHLGYVVTWYGLAAALMGVYIAFGRARAKEATS